MTTPLMDYYASLAVSPPPGPVGNFVQSTFYYSGGGSFAGPFPLAFPSNVTAGDLILTIIGWVPGGGGAMTIADSQSNTYGPGSNSGSPYVSASGYDSQLFWTVANTTGPLTVTTTPPASGNNFVRMIVAQYHGWTTHDTEKLYTFASNTTPSTTITTTSPNELIVSWCIDNLQVVDFRSPFTLRQYVPANSYALGDSLSNPIASTYTCTADVNGGNGVMILESFR